jgi:transcriptional regulator with XRE-family HTH domain
MKAQSPPAPAADPIVTSPVDLGRILRASRKAGGLTLEQAAAGLGIAKQTLQDLERGTGTVGLAIALRVAAELGVTLFTAPPGLKGQVRHWLQERS